MPTRRELLLGLTAVAALGACAAQSPSAGRTDGTELDQMVSRLTARTSRKQEYRQPTAAERDQAVTAVRDLLTATPSPDTAAVLGGLGFALSAGRTDPPTGRTYHLAVSDSTTERSWGAIVVDPGGPRSLLVEVPHTRSDKGTENLGLALWRAVPGSVLLLAGAHRDAAGGRADVAHEPDSLFHAIVTSLADQGFPQIQLHGFADDTAPGEETVVSAGVGDPALLAERIAAGLAGAGMKVCRTWQGDCRSLAAQQNVQGMAAAQRRQPFVHLEISRSVREDDGQQAPLVAALAKTVTGVAAPS